jgi:hypothetical protein
VVAGYRALLSHAAGVFLSDAVKQFKVNRTDGIMANQNNKSCCIVDNHYMEKWRK